MIQEEAPGTYILPYENISDLNEEEKDLIGYIDRLVMSGDVIDRGKEFAKVKAKANRAQARFAPFTDSRDFYYVNDMELDCSSENDMEVNLHPVLCGLPDKLQKHLQGNMEEVQTVSQDGHRNHIFMEPSVCNSYNAMKKMDKLIGTQVPRFIEQPLSFIPEGVSFDKDLFAKRVKGLKIHKSSAVPYIRVEKSEEEPGWFDVSAEILLRENSMEEDSEEYDTAED